MHGYWGNPEKTAASLVPPPSVEGPGDRAYKTGDLVRVLADGSFQLIGRRDHQIKSRGYRIELGDIETAIYAHPGVLECAVVAVPDETVTNRLLAHVVVREGIGRSDLVKHLTQRVPRYMVPDAFRFADELPKTSTGKIDRQALDDEISPAGAGGVPRAR
jgi:acyl-coenzyme A synthetase/AMP-(fatty) acid ligase